MIEELNGVKKGIIKRIGQISLGIFTSKYKNIAVWEHQIDGNQGLLDKKLVYRLRLGHRGDGEKGGFVVKEFERALFLENGQLIDVVPPGMWLIEKAYKQDGSEIIWVDMTQFKFNWGFNDILTQDFAKVGAHGTVLFKVREPRSFILNLISDKKQVYQNEIEEFIWDSLKSVIKNSLGKYAIVQLVRQREIFEAQIRATFHDLLEKWGLDIDSLEVVGFKLPKEFEHLFQQKANNVVETAQLDLTKQKISRDSDLTKTSLNADQEINVLKVQQNQQVDILQDQNEIERLRLEEQKLAIKNRMRLANTDVNEIEGMSGVRVQNASNNQALNHEYELAKIRQLENIEVARAQSDGRIAQQVAGVMKDVGLTKGGYDRDVSVAYAAADARGIERNHELNVARAGYDRDTSVIRQAGADVVGNTSRIAELEEKLKDKEVQIEKLDNILIEGKLSQELYERRMNLIMNQMEDIRREILELKRP